MDDDKAAEPTFTAAEVEAALAAELAVRYHLSDEVALLWTRPYLARLTGKQDPPPPGDPPEPIIP